jgi:hypothetical protein
MGDEHTWRYLEMPPGAFDTLRVLHLSHIACLFGLCSV